MPVSKLAARRILKSSCAARVSEDASGTLADLINAFAYGVARKAVKLAKHAKRKTVERADIELAK